jgi:hypothetical protein
MRLFTELEPWMSRVSVTFPNGMHSACIWVDDRMTKVSVRRGGWAGWVVIDGGPPRKTITTEATRNEALRHAARFVARQAGLLP